MPTIGAQRMRTLPADNARRNCYWLASLLFSAALLVTLAWWMWRQPAGNKTAPAASTGRPQLVLNEPPHPQVTAEELRAAGIGEATPDANNTDEEIKRHVYASILPEDAKDFVKMGPPQQGEWLARFREEPQSLEKYKFTVRIRPTPQRRTIVLQPLIEPGVAERGAEEKKFLEALREYCEVFFQLPARVAEPLELAVERMELKRNLPIGHRHGIYGCQYDADKILDHLLFKKLPEDAVAYLGITMADLWSGDLNYVFGLGSMDRRVGVYSLCRYFPEFWGRTREAGDEELALRRACKVLNHETGHIFGLGHCVFYHCSMNGSNSLAETDLAPIHFCPVCHRKLQWNIGFDPLKRYEALQSFYQKHKLAQDAAWLATRIQNWKLTAAREKVAKDE